MSKIIRTPTCARGGVTAEEKLRLDEHAKLWISRALRTAPIQPDEIVPAIKAVYRAAGLREPRVVIVPSPLVMAFAYGASAAIWYTRAGAATDAATRAATDDATRAATDDATDANPERGAAAACRFLAGNLAISCAVRWSNAYQGGNMWAPWDCYLTAMRDIIGLRLSTHAAYGSWEHAAIHGGFRVMHEKFCLVSDFPEILRRDEQHRPHCETGPSHRWRDGWALYHWHGTRIPAAWIEDRASLTPQAALGQQNTELRRAACEILGWNNILAALNARLVDKDDDPQIGELLEVDLPDAPRERFLRAQCGTGRTIIVWVSKSHRTALEANAATYQIPPDLLKLKEHRT